MREVKRIVDFAHRVIVTNTPAQPSSTHSAAQAPLRTVGEIAQRAASTLAPEEFVLVPPAAPEVAAAPAASSVPAPQESGTLGSLVMESRSCSVSSLSNAPAELAASAAGTFLGYAVSNNLLATFFGPAAGFAIPAFASMATEYVQNKIFGPAPRKATYLETTQTALLSVGLNNHDLAHLNIQAWADKLASCSFNQQYALLDMLKQLKDRNILDAASATALLSSKAPKELALAVRKYPQAFQAASVRAAMLVSSKPLLLASTATFLKSAGLDHFYLGQIDIAAWAEKLQGSSKPHQMSLICGLLKLKEGNILSAECARDLLVSKVPKDFALAMLQLRHFGDAPRRTALAESLQPLALGSILETLRVKGILDASTLNLAKNSKDLKGLAEAVQILDKAGLLHNEQNSIHEAPKGLLEGLTYRGQVRNGECFVRVMTSENPKSLAMAYATLKAAHLLRDRENVNAMYHSKDPQATAAALAELEAIPGVKLPLAYEEVRKHRNPAALASAMKSLRTAKGEQPKEFLTNLINYAGNLDALAAGLHHCNEGKGLSIEATRDLLVCKNPVALGKVYKILSEAAIFNEANRILVRQVPSSAALTELAVAMEDLQRSGVFIKVDPLRATVQEKIDRMNEIFTALVSSGKPLAPAREQLATVARQKIEQAAAAAKAQEAQQRALQEAEAKQKERIQAAEAEAKNQAARMLEEKAQAQRDNLANARATLKNNGFKGRAHAKSIEAVENSPDHLRMAEALVRLKQLGRLNPASREVLVAEDKNLIGPNALLEKAEAIALI